MGRDQSLEAGSSGHAATCSGTLNGSNAVLIEFDRRGSFVECVRTPKHGTIQQNDGPITAIEAVASQQLAGR